MKRPLPQHLPHIQESEVESVFVTSAEMPNIRYYPIAFRFIPSLYSVYSGVMYPAYSFNLPDFSPVGKSQWRLYNSQRDVRRYGWAL